MIQENLTRYIKERGYKQCVVREAAGIKSDATFSNMMANKRKLTLDEYAAICRFLGVPMDYFNEE